MKKTIIAFAVALCPVACLCAQNGFSEHKPKVYAVADAHLDTQWNWDIQTTIKDYVWNTLYQTLFLLKHYPDYVFNFEGGVKYAWMKEYYPDYYQELKEFVKQGRWHISGASWDANDVLISSPESIIRNIMLGRISTRGEMDYIQNYLFGYMLGFIFAIVIVSSILKISMNALYRIIAAIFGVLAIHICGFIYCLILAIFKVISFGLIIPILKEIFLENILYDILFSILVILIAPYIKNVLWTCMKPKFERKPKKC